MEKEFKGTKGKWEVSDICTDTVGCHNIYTEHGKIITQFAAYEFRYCSIEETNANAKLIASAPDLLEALMSIENDNGSIPKAIWDMRNKAIEKALS